MTVWGSQDNNPLTFCETFIEVNSRRQTRLTLLHSHLKQDNLTIVDVTCLEFVTGLWTRSQSWSRKKSAFLGGGGVGSWRH